MIKRPSGAPPYLEVFRKVFTMWPVHLFSVAFTAHVLGIRIYNYFTIFLESSGYSVTDTNLIPTGAFGFQAGLTLVYAWVSDATQQRIPVIWFAAGPSLIGCVILSIYPEHNHAAMMVGWFLTYAETGASVLIMAMCNEVVSFSAEHRLVVIGVVETCAFVFDAWVILLAYPSGEASEIFYWIRDGRHVLCSPDHLFGSCKVLHEVVDAEHEAR